MKRITTLLLYVLLLPMAVAAQSWDEVRDNKEYISATGTGATVQEADRNALTYLISQISSYVSSDTRFGFREENKNQNIDHKSYVESHMRTYSQATLTNTERLIIKNEPDAVVGRYIKKAELKRIFANRQRKAIDMVHTALRAEDAGKADDALRNYYWALALVRSLQYPEEAFFEDDEGQKHMLTTWIPEQMNRVFDELKVSVVSRKGDDVDLSIAYKGRPVASVDYTYFDGRDWSAINSAKDGTGVLELAKGNQSTKYQLKFEYEYQSEAHIDKEVETVLKVLGSQAMRKSYTTVDASDIKGEAFASRESFSQTDASVRKAPTMTAAQGNEYAQAMTAIIKAIDSRQTAGAERYFTSEGLEMFRRLVFSYGTPRIMGTPECRRRGDGTWRQGVVHVQERCQKIVRRGPGLQLQRAAEGDERVLRTGQDGRGRHSEQRRVERGIAQGTDGISGEL